MIGQPGEGADLVHLLTAGRVAELHVRDGAAPRIGAIHRPGAILGGSAFLGCAPSPFALTALRDTEVVALERPVLEPLLRRRPELLAELARASLLGVRAPDAAARRQASILGFVAVCESVAMRAFVEDLATRMRTLGVSVAVLGAEHDNLASGALSAIEARHDYVLMAAERGDVDFTRYCGRQIDRLILVGSAHSPLPDDPVTFAAAAIRRHRLLDFVLLQPPGATRPQNSARWLSAAPFARLLQLRLGDVRDLDRLARTFTGRSVGVVLSGGGARAYAHVGVLRALEELGIAVDFVSGASMGAVIAAGVAMGWSLDELDRRIREAFVASSPLSDIAFPLLAMTRGVEVERRLKTHFADVEISDLWLPFECVSTNLTTGRLHEHRSGLVRSALRATISLPGVLPPVVENGHVLVDGALVRNLPADLMRMRHDGMTVGVDVAGASGLEPSELRLNPPGLRWLTSGSWLKGPPIVSVLIRAASLPAARLGELSVQGALDVTISPMLDRVQLRDWKSYEPAVEAGYRATMAAADALTQGRRQC
jgi:NTE family protein